MTYKQILESYYHMVRQLYRKKHEEKKTIKKVDIKMDPFPILRGKGSLPFASV